MRRVAALLAAIALTASLTGSSLAATSPTKNSFVGDFDLIDQETGEVVGHVEARLFVPTDQHLVPGSYDFKGSPGNWIRESHSVIGSVQFWYDVNNPAPGLGGSNVAFGEGVECQYIEPGYSVCQTLAVMFIDDLDPSLPDQVAFASEWNPEAGDWDWSWWHVGSGDFVLHFYGSN